MDMETRRQEFERAIGGQIERRTIVTELRASESDGARYITGHGAVFDQEAEIWDGIFEVVRAGAFIDTMNRADVRALFNHDPNFVLGRNRAGTLQLSEDEIGLAYRILLNEDVSYARDLYASLQRGDITQSSYAFLPVQQRWTDREDGTQLRELLQVDLFDVSPVTYPAFLGADSQARGIFVPTSVATGRPPEATEGATPVDRAGALRLRRARLKLTLS